MMSARPSIAEFLQEQKPPSVKEFLAQADEPPRDASQSASLESVDVEALPETDWLPAASPAVSSQLKASPPVSFTVTGAHEELEPADIERLTREGDNPDDFVKVRHEMGKPLLVHRRRLVDQPPQPNDQAATGVPTSTSLTSFASPPVTFNAPDAPVSPQPDRAPMPESRHTLDAQMQAMLEGRRNAVLVTPGAEWPPVPRGYTATQTPEGIFIHDPRRVAASLIHSLVENKRHGELMGHVEPVSDQTTAGVVARDPQTGQELQASYVSPENVPAQAAALQDQFPGASVEAGGAELESRVLNDRAAALSGDITGGLSQLGEPPAPREPNTSTPSVKEFLERERITSQTREDVDFSDMETREPPPSGSPDAVRIPVKLAPGEENSIEPDELARRAVYQFADTHKIPLEFTNKWIVEQEKLGNLRLHRLSDNQPTTMQELIKTSAYDPQSNTVTLHGDLPFFPQLLSDYERDKGYVQRIKDDYADPNKKAGAVALDVVGPPAAAAVHGVELASRSVQAVSTGLSGVARALDPGGAVRLSEMAAGKQPSNPVDTLRGIPGAMYEELATGETRPGYENPTTAVVDNLAGPALERASPGLHALVKTTTDLIGDPLVVLGAVGKAGRVARMARAGAEVSEAASADARLAELAATLEKRLGVRPTLERMIDDSIKVTADLRDGGEPVTFRIPRGGITSATSTPVVNRVTPVHNIKEQIYSALSAPRSVITAGDLSASGRQGAALSAGHPVRAAQAFKAQLGAFASEEKARRAMAAIRTRPLNDVWERAGLFLPDLDDSALTFAQREEAFGSRAVRHVPLVRRSERAFNTFLNTLRSNVADDIYRAHPGMTDEELKQVASALNVLSGRGSLGPLNKHAADVAQVVFAPRLLASRIQAPLLLASRNPVVRREAARSLVSLVGANLGFLGLARMAGAKVELDPRSTDFMRARVGDTRIDLTGGFQAPIRYTTQLLLGQRKDVDTGEVKRASRLSVAERFGRTRLAPQVGIPLDLYTGEDITGTPVTLGSAVQSAGEFLSARDIWAAVQADRRRGGSGVRGAALGSLSILGVGVSTYSRKAREPEPMTPKQKSYIYNLADHSRANEDEVSARLFGGRKVSELNKEEATRLIGELKKETARAARDR